MPLVRAGPAIFLSPATACGCRAPHRWELWWCWDHRGSTKACSGFEWCMTELSKLESKQAQTAANQGPVRLKVLSLLVYSSVWLVFQRGQRLIAFSAVSGVDCCGAAAELYFMKSAQHFSVFLSTLMVSALQIMLVWEDITTGIAMVRWPIFKTHLFNYTWEPQDN